MILNLHAILPLSRANGPGLRSVIWFQGCSLGCPGCYNQATHSYDPKLPLRVDDVLGRLESAYEHVEGLSVSGGEPLDQPLGLLELLTILKGRSSWSTILYSGYDLEEIKKMPYGVNILACVDVLISGRFMVEQRLDCGMRGSSNQEVHFFTRRYGPDDLEVTPPAEIEIDQSGRICVSGIDPPELDRLASSMSTRFGVQGVGWE